MAVDDPSLLPEPPPPRPARRDAAIQAALRRFDGIEEPTPARAPSSGRGFGSKPYFGALVTASLVMLIGLPAVLIAIRDNQPPASVTQARKEPAVRSPAKPVPEPAAGVAAVADSAVPVPASPPANLPAPDRRLAPSDATEDGAGVAGFAAPPVLAEAVGPPPPAVPFAAAAPPPPPPAPSARQENSAAERETADSQVVVTGSRIAAPNALEQQVRDGRGRSSASPLKVMEPAAAPKWVLENPSYRAFLTRLQALVRANDRQGVVKLVRVPLRVNFTSGAKTYRDSRSILTDYDRIFTPAVRSAILAQRFENLFGRDQGVMIGSGEVWFDRSCKNQSCTSPGPVRITAINP